MRIFSACARSATMEPMLPQPISPRVLPASSLPTKRAFCHSPACVERSAWGMRRASASISASVCSAVVTELPNGVFMTTTPRAVAAPTSMLSTPMPARPMTRRPLAAASTRSVTFVDERTARPS